MSWRAAHGKTAFVLSGGGSLGAIQVGMLAARVSVLQAIPEGSDAAAGCEAGGGEAGRVRSTGRPSRLKRFPRTL